MRGLLLVLCLGLGLAPAAADSGEPGPAAGDPEFRLLELGGKIVRWSAPAEGLPPTITYAFLTEPRSFPGARNCDSMLSPDAALKRSNIDVPDFRSEVRAAFALWANAANIKFKEVHAADAGILIGADAKDRGRAFTNVALKSVAGRGTGKRNVGQIAQSLICFNPHQRWKIGFDGDLNVYDLRFTMAHEIGHAIGLDHPSPQGQLMSFRYLEDGRALTAGDIAGAHALYGRRDRTAVPARQAATTRGGRRTPDADVARPRERTFGLGARDASER